MCQVRKCRPHGFTHEGLTSLLRDYGECRALSTRSREEERLIALNVPHSLLQAPVNVVLRIHVGRFADRVVARVRPQDNIVAFFHRQDGEEEDMAKLVGRGFIGAVGAVGEKVVADVAVSLSLQEHVFTLDVTGVVDRDNFQHL